MKLLVRLIEARNIPALDPNGFSDPYVKLKLGRQKFRSKVVKKSLNPSWCEEFSFRVEDLKEELKIYVLDEDKFCKDDFVGFIKVPVSRVLDAEGQSLGTAWYSLQPKKKSKIQDCGELNSFYDYLFLFVFLNRKICYFHPLFVDSKEELVS